MRTFVKIAFEALRTANSWRLQGQDAQRMTSAYLATTSALSLLTVLIFPFTLAARPLASASASAVACSFALYCWHLSRKGFPVKAVHLYGPVLWLVVLVPYLTFGRNPAFCALIIFSMVPLYAAVAGVVAAGLYVLSFFVASIAFLFALRWGFDPPVYFPLAMPVQLAVAGLGALAALFPMLSVLNGIQKERQHTEHELAERKAAERALERLTQNLADQLAHSELVMRSSIETIGEAFVIYDAQDRLAFCNEEYRQTYKASAPVIKVGHTFEEIIRYGAERGQYPDAVGRVDAWMAQRLAQHQLGNTNLVQKLEDGRWLKILERKTPSGHTVGFRVDITELYRAKEAAEAASLTKSRFLATMSHEIRTPMNGMLGMAQVLLNPELAYQERHECAQAILRSGGTMLTLLNDILDFSKMEADKFELRAAEFSPVKLAQDISQLFGPTAHFKKISVYMESALDPDRRYWADSVRIRQMLSNLIGNAVKFTAQGSIRVDVAEVPSPGDSAMLEFSVTDTGGGIGAEQIEQLFQPFTQLDGSATRKYEGSGLGLSIVKKLAELMGGSVGLTSEIGRGSRFWFRVRADILPGGASASPITSGTAAEGAAARLRGHLLVAEDDPIHRKVIGVILAKLGLTHVAVEDGQQALDAIATGEHFDLVLMDINMPVIDGLAATRSIRQWQGDHARPQTPIVAITADAFSEDRQRCSEAGMDDFLAKPIYLQRLSVTLEKWLPQADPVSSVPQAPTSRKTLDQERFAEMVADLAAPLMAHSFDAFSRFKALQAVVADTELESEMQDIGKLLNAMNFEHVHQRLQKLAAASPWRMPA